jgi:hypothetical protein
MQQYAWSHIKVKEQLVTRHDIEKIFSLLQFSLLIETKRIRHKFYQLIKFSLLNCITIITDIHME